MESNADRPLRSLHCIVPEPPGSVGGADMHVRDLAAAQLHRGQTSPVVFETLSPPFAARVRAAGVECVSVAGMGKRALLRNLRELIVGERIDIVHAHGYDATWWAVAALALTRIRPPLVVTCHGWIETTTKLRFMSTADRAANRLAAGVIVVSDEMIPTALEFATRARAFAMIPNGVPILPIQDDASVRERLGIPIAVPLVGAMGRLSAEKRHDRFLDACALIARHRPDVHFVLAGGGPLRNGLEEYAAKLGLSDRLHMVGVVDQPEALLRECDVVVQPSDVETTSRVVLEAMAQARPVVATNVGGMELLIRHDETGVLVAAGSPDPIATEVLQLLEQPDRADQLGKLARETVIDRFDADTMAAAVDDVYQAVVGRPSTRHQTWVRKRQ